MKTLLNRVFGRTVSSSDVKRTRPAESNRSGWWRGTAWGRSKPRFMLFNQPFCAKRPNWRGRFRVLSAEMTGAVENNANST